MKKFFLAMTAGAVLSYGTSQVIAQPAALCETPTARENNGITAARNAYNANVPVDSVGPFATNGEYWSFVAKRAWASYVNQYNVPE